MNDSGLEGLHDLSRSFAKALFAALPKLREHARANEGVLRIELEPAPARPTCGFWISTDDNEVTVGFGEYHAHFEWPPTSGHVLDDPIEFARSILSDEFVVVDWTRDGDWKRSRVSRAGEEPDLADLRPGDVVHVRSWSGAHDREIRGR